MPKLPQRFPGCISQVRGVRAGHAQDRQGCTGVTAVLCGSDAVGGADVRGAAPGTRETDLLRPGNLVQGPNAILLCGGSAFGLAAADGAMRFLRERGVGLDVGVGVVPIVPAAVLFDLACGDAGAFPDAAMGYEACAAALRALKHEGVLQGREGAGCGATVGKLIPGTRPAFGGVGSASLRVGEATVGALVAVNAAGDVFHPVTGAWLAGSRLADGTPVCANDVLCSGALAGAPMDPKIGIAGPTEKVGENTTIGVVATDAKLTKEQCARLALSAHDGYARCIRPAHTQLDGDTVFSVATGRVEADIPFIALCAAAAEVTARAIANAVTAFEVHP